VLRLPHVPRRLPCVPHASQVCRVCARRVPRSFLSPASSSASSAGALDRSATQKMLSGLGFTWQRLDDWTIGSLDDSA
jgi:hypothetical protein